MKRFLKISGITFLTILLIMGLFLELSFSFSNEVSKNNYSEIMLNGLEQRYQTRVVDVGMLGAHDAFSNNISFSSSLDPATEGIFASPFRDLMKGLTVRLSKAQLSDTKALLKAGVRYFDVRISYVNGEFVTKHNLISNPLKENLEALLTFLDQYPSEFIIFDIQHAYLKNSSFEKLIEYLSEIKVNEKSLLDYVHYKTNGDEKKELESLTYGDVTKNGSSGGVIILAKIEENEKNAYLFPYQKSIRSTWHNEINDTIMIDHINKESNYLENNQELYKNVFRVNQAQKTGGMSSNMLLETIFGWSLIDLANSFNNKIVNHENFDTWLNQMPIVMVDFADCNTNDFNKKINDKIIHFNKNNNNLSFS